MCPFFCSRPFKFFSWFFGGRGVLLYYQWLFHFVSFRCYIIYRKRILFFKLESGKYFYLLLCQVSKRILENNVAEVSFSFSVCICVGNFFFPFLSKGGRWGCSVIRKETICAVGIRRKQLKSLYFSIFFYLFIADSKGVAEC